MELPPNILFFAFNWMVQYGDQYTLDPSEFILGNFMFIMFFDPGTMFENSKFL